MQKLFEEKREQNSLRIRREARKALVSEKRAKTMPLSEEERETIVGESLHFYEIQLQLPCSCQEFAMAVRGISELIAKHGKQPEVCTINAILNSSHSRLFQHEVTHLLVNVTSLDSVNPATIELLSMATIPLAKMALSTEDLVLIENVLYIVGNLATQTTVQKEKLTTECCGFFKSVNELVRDKRLSHEFIDSLLWVYTNILIRNKQSEHAQDHLCQQFLSAIVELLAFLMSRLSTLQEYTATISPNQLKLIQKTRGQAIRLTKLIITLSNKEAAQQLWPVGLQTTVSCTLQLLGLLVRCPHLFDIHLIAELFELFTVAHSLGSRYVPNELNAMLVELLHLFEKELFSEQGEPALVQLVNLIRCMKYQNLTWQLLQRFELFWKYQPHVELVYQLSKFMVELFGSVSLERTCSDLAILRAMLRRLPSLLDYNHEEVVLNGLRCLLFLCDRNLDQQALHALIEETGLSHRLINLQMHANKQIYELAMQLLQLLNIQE